MTIVRLRLFLTQSLITVFQILQLQDEILSTSKQVCSAYTYLQRH